jgi:RNA polymerase sigma-70 factor (ECF subfamily)
LDSSIQTSTYLSETQGDSVAADLELAAAVLRKERKATAEFVNRFSNGQYAYLHRRLVPRTDLVDDLLQEIFLAALVSLERFQGRSSLRAWLHGIARHKVEDHYRQQLRHPEGVPDDDLESESALALEPPFDESLDRERLETRTRQVLESLPDPYRAALLWRYWEGRNAQEMAMRTGKSEKAIERLLARARQQFRRRWKDEYDAA